MCGIQTVCLHKLGRSAGLTEAVGSVDKFYRSRLACCKNAGNGLSETSCHIVLLCNDCATCLGDAVKRNLLKRRMRESYRTQKSILDAGRYDIMFVWTSRELADSNVIREETAQLLKRISK